MGGSNPAQVVSPLEAKLIRVEAGKSRDRSVEGFARRWRWRDGCLAGAVCVSSRRHHAARRVRRFAARPGRSGGASQVCDASACGAMRTKARDGFIKALRDAHRWLDELLVDPTQT